MKVVILAGGFGTRISEYTSQIPKPMVRIGGKPILFHIMERYAKFGHDDFYIATGYKSEVIKEYFLNFRTLNSDFSVDLENGKIEMCSSNSIKWRVTLVDTGELTMTGGRVKRMQEFIGRETCMLTYGDGLSDIDFYQLERFHRNHGRRITVSAVRPGARFGELVIDDSKVIGFEEKPQMNDGWINGGFFMLEPAFFDLIDDDTTVLERGPLERATSMGELQAYKHEGFWQCMDTKRDHDLLENIWSGAKAPWTRLD